ncbi:MAG: inner membrane CreD family protein [Deltaproteobacteria bacterium]|nr:inner membrane CreD family protein [Deltaproteobacteria bacterium]
MTPLRLIAIGAIFLFTTVGWMVLGGTVVERTGSSDGRIRHEVEALWGSEHNQRPPAVSIDRLRTETRFDETIVAGKTTTTSREVVNRQSPGADLLTSKVDVELDLEHRKKGLLWWPTYSVGFQAHYRFDLPRPEVTPDVVVVDTIQIVVPLSAMNAVYDGFHVKVDGVEYTPQPGGSEHHNSFVVRLPRAGKSAINVDVGYKSRGLGSWTYALGQNGSTSQVKDLALNVKTNVSPVDFPLGTLSPTTKKADGDGEVLSWTFDSLVTGQNIGVELPAKLNPGPVAARIAFFAPVGLLFFFTVMIIIGVVKKQSLHPMNYFFLAAAFFAFHLLFAYLVDVADLGVAFAVASVCSLFLVTSYLRIVQGAKVAFLQAGTAQLVFLIGFSLAFFREGQSGLTIAIGSVVTLFLLMQLTARVKWAEIFGAEPPQHAGSSVGIPSFGTAPPASSSTSSTKLP